MEKKMQQAVCKLRHAGWTECYSRLQLRSNVREFCVRSAYMWNAQAFLVHVQNPECLEPGVEMRTFTVINRASIFLSISSCTMATQDSESDDQWEGEEEDRLV